jgi:Ca-activated chloride channel family protein
MKPNQEQVEDQLLDALLHEQNPSDREQALAQIENAINGKELSNLVPVRSKWPKRLGIIAASIVLGGTTVYCIDSSRKEKPLMAQLEEQISPKQERENLLTSIRAQEEIVEQRSKVLTTISRTKDIVWNDPNDKRTLLERSIDPQDYADAKRDYEADEEQLEDLKLRLGDLAQDAETALAANEPKSDDILRKPSPPSSSAPRAILVAPSSSVGMSLPEIALNSSPTDFARDEELGLRSGDLGGAGGAFSLPGAKRKELALLRDKSPNTERYGPLIDPSWQQPTENPLSTFSIDVDTASYANIRRFISEGRAIPTDAVRIEECINAFKYQYEPPAGDKAFAVHTELATCPWNEDNLLVKIGIKGREIAREKRPVSNLVFLIDVSGSMQSNNKLPLVKESLKLLLHQLDERDSVSYVVYAGREGVVLPPTKMTESGRVKALEALEKLESGGSTNGGAGITRAYQLAMENFIDGGVNRVILASDGDFNVGVTGQDALVKIVKERAAKNIYLSALAFGTGNLNDAMFEAISNDGNGNYFYIDSIRESRKVFLENLTGSLITIAKDVKIQVEFNPSKVGSYRLIGYANRVLKDEDFNNDKVDAGDIGAGHTVTAFYEIVPAGLPQPNGGVDVLKYQKTPPAEKAPIAEPSDEWLTLKLRHKHPEGDISALQESVVKGQASPWQESGSDFQFATAVAIFGMKLRGMSDVSSIPWDGVRQLAQAGLKEDKSEDRAEFVELIAELEKRK